MYKRTITYTDYDGNERTEDFFFYLSKAELVRLNYSYEGGFENTMKAIIGEKDKKKLYALFEEIVLMSYGKKSPDGKRFVKSQELRDEFVQTEAYSDFILSLLSDNNLASEFVSKIIPSDLEEKVNKALLEKGITN